MAENKKFYFMTMREQNGEQRYSYKYLIMAKDMEEAEEIAREHASTFYGESTAEDDDVFYFNGGALATQVLNVTETDLATFLMFHLTTYTLGGLVPKQQIEIGY